MSPKPFTLSSLAGPRRVAGLRAGGGADADPDAPPPFVVAAAGNGRRWVRLGRNILIAVL
jgi:hypothetical protein